MLWFDSKLKLHLLEPTQEAVRRQLAEEDRQAQLKGKAYALHPLFTASELIAVGLELEEMQYVILLV